MGAKKGKKGKGGEDEEDPTENLLKQYKTAIAQLGCEKSKDFIKKIDDAQEDGEQLQEILINEKIGEFGARAISTALTKSTKGNKGFPTLVSLRIWEGDIQDEGVRAFHQFIINTNNTSLKLIEFLNCNIGPLGCEFLSRCFEPSLPTKIQILTLDYNEFGNEGVKQLMNYLPKSPSINYLSLAYCGIDENGVDYMEEFVTVTSSLQKLILMGNPLKDEGIQKLFGYLAGNKTLEEINVNNTSFGISPDSVDKVTQLFDANQNIYIYRMKFNLISLDNMLAIFNSVKEHPHLYIVEMDDEKFKPEVFKEFAGIMKKRKPPKKKKAKKKKKK